MVKDGYSIDYSEFRDYVKIVTAFVNSDWMERIVKEARDIMLEEAKRLCPVDTGKLKASLKCEWKETWDGYKITLSTDIEYGKFIEYGTINIKVGSPENPIPSVKQSTYRPFMRPALLKTVNFVKKEIEKELKKLEG